MTPVEFDAWVEKLKEDNMQLPRKLLSRKLWITIITAVVLVASEATGLDLTDVQTSAIAVVSAVYVLAEGLIDAVGRLPRPWRAPSPPPPPPV